MTGDEMKYSNKPRHFNKVKQDWKKSKRRFKKAGGMQLDRKISKRR
jgi:hypothetical protein